MTEDQLQRATACILDMSGLLWCHPPNGGQRSAKTGAKLKSFGAKRGVPDCLIFQPFEVGGIRFSGLAIELKVGKNTTSKEQREWGAKLAANGWMWVVSRSLEGVHEVLRIAYGAKFP